MHAIRAFILLGALACYDVAYAQSIGLSKGNGQWLHYYNQTKVSENWNLQFDGGYRWSEYFQHSSQYIVRTGVGYCFNPTVSVSTGFAHLGFLSNEKVARMEFRPYQELFIKQPIRSVELLHRYRVEGRFFRPFANGEMQEPASFNVRFRYAIMLRIPLFKLSTKHPSMKVELNVGDELFINAGKGIVYNVFDQNRVIISPTIHFTDGLAVSFTYISLFGAVNEKAKYVYRDIVWLQVRHRLSFTRKQPQP